MSDNKTSTEDIYGNCLKGLGAFKARWIAALRSGRYQQGEHVLRSEDNKFCCLGVACNLIDPSAWDSQVTVSPGDDRGLKWKGLLPWMADEMLAAKLRMAPEDVLTLANMNDASHDFDSIANYIAHKVNV